MVVLTATAILARYRDGELNGDTPIRILKDAPAKPLRAYIQELVWEALREADNTHDKTAPSRHFQIAFEHAPIGMARSDLAGRITEVNPALANLLEYEADDLIGRRVGEISDP